MYKSIRSVRIIISLVAMAVPAWALLAGYDSVFIRMQILTAILSGAALCLLFWVVITLIYGRIYCSTVCPLGTLMDCTAAASRIATRRNRNYHYVAPSMRTRIIFLLTTLLTLLSGSALLSSLLDPYSAFARIIEELIAKPLGINPGAAPFSIATLAVAALTAAVVLAASLRNGRILCNTACPVGTILGTGAKKAYFHIEIDPDKCINCGECERVCKSQCIKLPEKLVDNTRCVVCFNCTSVCPNEAINYKSGRYRLGMPMMQSLEGANGSALHNSCTPLPEKCSNCKRDKK